METLQITKEAALTAHKKTNEDGKSLLENLFGKRHFLTKTIDRIKTFEDACEELGEDPALFNVGTADEVAYKKLKVVVRALNGDWRPDWNNGNQRKWAPWFYLDNPGFRFYGSLYDLTCTSATGGSRICYATEELANYAAKQFLDLYKAFLA